MRLWGDSEHFVRISVTAGAAGEAPAHGRTWLQSRAVLHPLDSLLVELRDTLVPSAAPGMAEGARDAGT